MSLFVRKGLIEFQNFLLVVIISIDKSFWKCCFFTYVLINKKIARSYPKHFTEKCSVLLRNLFIIHSASTFMKRGFIPLTLESGINVSSSPQLNFIGKITWKHFNNPLSSLPSLIGFCQKMKKWKMNLIKTKVFQG